MKGGKPHAETKRCSGDREAIRRQTVAAALRGIDAQL